MDGQSVFSIQMMYILKFRSFSNPLTFLGMTSRICYGWNVLRVGDANDIDRIERAFDIFHKTKERPTFIILDSHIGYGSPHKQDTAAAHSESLGDEEVHLSNATTVHQKKRPFWFPTPFANASRPALAGEARRRAVDGPSSSSNTARNIQSSRPRST